MMLGFLGPEASAPRVFPTSRCAERSGTLSTCRAERAAWATRYAKVPDRCSGRPRACLAVGAPTPSAEDEGIRATEVLPAGKPFGLA
eukprot:176473-Pyramimonas_sp.AAC.1